MYNILVVYWDNMPAMRTTTRDHLYCFGRYLDHRVYYVNLKDRMLPWYVTDVDYDIVVFHDLFFCGRWGGRALFEKLCRKIDVLRSSPALKIAVPQDEFISADLLCEFINAFGIEAVFSVSPESEWPKIYRDIDRARVSLYCVLTGYLDDVTQAHIEAIATATPLRPIDIGYRAGGRNWREAAWLGHHGRLKIEIADVFAEAAPRHGLTTDISTRSEDTFIGDDWYRFLARCKYQIGLEGGASILDWDGTLRVKTLAYVEAHPEASLAEIEAECFPGLDGAFALYALSPRHLEACATRTCQILVEGDYNGVLEAGRHYLPVRRDFADLGAVLERARDERLRERIVDAAYRDIVASGRYTYRRFAEFIVAESERIRPALRQRRRHGLRSNWHYARFRAAQRMSQTRRVAEAGAIGAVVRRAAHALLRRGGARPGRMERQLPGR